ncbi:MAG TPA: transketolase C-terminal domain-containing protein [Thermoanaerobaculia bacterium]|nr:transketolase C-terminal domain-containing protein [Thermoanaerobaculia bacterium]HQR65989.1 transketolase C-terminal domain-containing protein [Thermoanaerobaculia bacterium]
MREMTYARAIEDALAEAMEADERVVVFGEDVRALRMNLFVRFGPRRVRNAPISESAFLGAAVGAAMAGLRPVAELIMIDFLAVAADALVNQAAKVEAFSGGRWKVPMVLRAGCGGGYGDGGQHEQALWGWLAHVPGIKVVAPSTPADAGGLLTAAIADEGPVVFLEHQLLSEDWLDYLGAGGRTTVSYDVPAAGRRGEVPDRWEPIPLGEAAVCRTGSDLTIAGVGVGIHRAAEAASLLAGEGLSASVIDLRSLAPLDRGAVVADVRRTGRLLVVDEDYRDFGLTGELAAALLEAGLAPRYARVAVEGTIPFDPARERAALPSVERIVSGARRLLA